MQRRIAVLCLFAGLLSGTALGQDYSGTYTLGTQGGTNTLVLKQDAQGKVSGTLTPSQGPAYKLAGEESQGSVVGILVSGASSGFFKAELNGNELTFFIVPPKADHQPDIARAQRFVFERRGGGAPLPRAPAATGGGIPAGDAGPLAGSPSGRAAAVNDPYLGIHFDPPAGWNYRKTNGVYILGHETIPGMILIMPHTFNSLAEARAAASEPLYAAQDGRLMVTGQPQMLADNMLAADYSGYVQGKAAHGRVVCVISPYGGGVLILAGAAASQYSQRYADLAENLARGMTFTKPVNPPAVQQWAARLRGHRLAYMTSGGDATPVDGSAYSWSDRKNIYLCSNGTFQAQGGFSGSIGTPSATGIVRNGTGTWSGRWKVASVGGAPILELDVQGRGTVSYRLSARGSKTYLDGKRWFVVENTVCR